jgi:hypothetical protein
MGETQQNRLLGCDLDHLGTGIIVFGITILNQALDVCFSFDVGRWTFDVGRSSLKPTLYGINVTCECLQNNLALMGLSP